MTSHTAGMGGFVIAGGPGFLEADLCLAYGLIAVCVFCLVWRMRKAAREAGRQKAALAQSEARFRRIVETAHEGIWETDAQLRTTLVNARLLEMLGFAAEEMQGRSLLEFSDESTRASLKTFLETCGVERGHKQDFAFKRKDGGTLWAIVSSVAMSDGADRRTGVMAMFTDITERKRSERELAEAQQLSMLGSWSWDVRSDEVVWSGEMYRIYGYDPGLPPPRFAELKERFTAESWAHVRANVEQTLRTRAPYVIELELTLPDGSHKWIVGRGKAVCDAGGTVVSLFGTTQDITARKSFEAELHILERAIHELGLGVLLADPSQPDVPTLYVNPAFSALTGYSSQDVIGRNCRFLQGPETDPAVVEIIRRAVREARGCTVELINYRKDGTKFWNSLNVSPVHDAAGKLVRFIAVQTDVTAVRQLQEQYQQSQKMEAFGQLAGGVAHDFNNILGVILGYCDLMNLQLPEASPLRACVDEIEIAGERAAGLTRQLLAFSRKQTLQPQSLNLGSVVADLEKMLRRLIGEHLELRTHSQEALWTVRADRGQIEQVLLNLTVNARDAMPEGGVIRIETSNFTVRADAETGDIAPGDYVRVSVSDTGCGMSEEVKARLFEPFFTTKEKGRGTGLGLATCYGIVEQSGGHITVQSELGRGTTFGVYLPRMGNQIVEPSESASPSGSLPGGSEKILLVEDDDALLLVTARLLRNLGYSVLEARDGLQAQRLIEASQAGEIDLVLTDVVMPGMSGKALGDWILSERPGTRLLFTSGYIDDTLARENMQSIGFLQKPSRPAELAAKLREVLRSPASLA